MLHKVAPYKFHGQHEFLEIFVVVILSGAELKDLCVDEHLLPFSSADLPCALHHIVR